MTHVLVPMETFLSDRQIPVYGALGSYLQKLSKYNLLPLFVGSNMKQIAIDEIYQLADGVYFMGGGDFDPKYYGQKKHEKTAVTENLRDQLEVALLKRTLKDKKPFLGICRGCQALAIVSGGTLIQHVSDVVHHTDHALTRNQSYDDLTTQKKHPVIVEKTSKVYKLLKKDKIMVNSGHHQAVVAVGENLLMSGRSQDGIVEIIEHIDPDYFCFAVQSHPEVEEKGDLEPLFATFATAALRYNKNRKK